MVLFEARVQNVPCQFEHYTVRPRKRKPINRVNFSENCNDLSERFTLLPNSVYPLSFDTNYNDVLATHEQARTISNCDVKIDLRRMGI